MDGQLKRTVSVGKERLPVEDDPPETVSGVPLVVQPAIELKHVTEAVHGQHVEDERPIPVLGVEEQGGEGLSLLGRGDVVPELGSRVGDGPQSLAVIQLRVLLHVVWLGPSESEYQRGRVALVGQVVL